MKKEYIKDGLGYDLDLLRPKNGPYMENPDRIKT